MIHFNTQELRRAFGYAASIVSPRPNVTALGYVQLWADSGTAVLTGSNSEITLQDALQYGGTPEEAVFLLPANRTARILATIEETELRIGVTDRRVEIEAGNAKFSLNRETDEFPVVKPAIPDSIWTVPARQFRDAITRTNYCCDLDNARFATGGVLYCLDPAGMRLVGTDGRRLSTAVVTTLRTGGGDPTSTTPKIVPQRANRAIVEALADSTEESDPAEIMWGPNTVTVTWQDRTVRAQLLTGKFPKWEQVLPQQREQPVVLPTEIFGRAVRRAVQIDSKLSRAATFQLKAGDLRIEHNSDDNNSQAISELPVGTDRELQFSLDGQYVQEAMQAIRESPTVEMYCEENGELVEFRTENCRQVICVMSRD